MRTISFFKRHIHSLYFILILVFGFQDVHGQFYYGTQTGFGKNRVQYDYFEWKYYRFPQYETYFYTGGQELAEYTAKVAKDYIKEQEDFFEYELKDKIQFIIYNKQSHFKQSNVGLDLEGGEVGGITNIMGSKVFLYFDGDHDEFTRQIKEGIAQVLVNQQVYGASWTQVLKNSSLLTLPQWYTKGLTSYMADPWNSDVENSVRDGILSGKYKKFNRLSDRDAIIAGHSMWAYIVDTYGEAVIPNILYMTRVTQSIEKGFLYVLGISMKSLTKEWLDYYTKNYENLASTPEEDYINKQLFKIRKRRDYLQFKASPDGNNFAYVTNQLGQYKIYIYYKDADKRYKIYKKEFKLDRINDYSYPVLEWHPSSEVLAFVTEEKGLLQMLFFDINTGGIQVKPLFNMEKVTGMDYSDSGKEMVFSGVYKGQSDLYLYYTGPNTHKKLTNDKFDDLDPRFIENSTQIAFTSNRTTDSLGYQPTDLELMANQKDVWILHYQADEPYLTKVSETPAVSEGQPFGVDSMLYFLGVQDGITTRLSAVKDSFITHIDTAIHYHHFYDVKPAQQFYNRSIREHSILQSGQYTEILKDDYKYYLMFRDLNEQQGDLSSVTPELRDTTERSEENITATPKNATLLKAVPLSGKQQEDTEDEALINISNYVFEKDKEKIQKNVVVVGDGANKKDSLVELFKLPNQRNYNFSFFNDNSGIKFSNSFVNGEYQQFTGGPYTSPGMGAFVKFGTIDLFEDYKIFGGVRISSNTREYFMTFQNLVSRWDKEYTASRTTYNTLDGNLALGFSTNSLKYSLKYPFSEVSSIRMTLASRNDQVVFKSTNDLTLAQPNFNEFRVIGKIAFVFDNSRQRMTNIYYGTKFKLFAEYYQEVGDGSFASTTRKLNSDGTVVGMGNGENGNMQVVGMDLRHSLKISREIVWVNRLAGSASFGYEKLIYYLGSLDEWIPLGGQQQFINQEDIDFSQNYRFHALAANMRGFPQNIRRGTNFAVVNSELRVPVFKYFIRRPIRSNFIRNFQLIGFTDVGSAWSGLDPWGKQNSVDKRIIEDGPVKVTVYRDINPIVAGYGFGVRTTFLGYFVRLDWAWGIEDGFRKDKPQFYLSLSLDI
ncbi:MAG: PD40 domain-containing protein [Flavobacteriales bacterium]|nr:PD40 domain-containing protein [Flavobacteriales bacterium]